MASAWRPQHEPQSADRMQAPKVAYAPHTKQSAKRHLIEIRLCRWFGSEQTGSHDAWFINQLSQRSKCSVP